MMKYSGYIIGVIVLILLVILSDYKPLKFILPIVALGIFLILFYNEIKFFITVQKETPQTGQIIDYKFITSDSEYDTDNKHNLLLTIKLDDTIVGKPYIQIRHTSFKKPVLGQKVKIRINEKNISESTIINKYDGLVSLIRVLIICLVAGNLIYYIIKKSP